VIWLGVIVRILAGLGMIVVGVAVARPASKGGGILLALAGAIELLTTCCVQVTLRLNEEGTLVGSGGEDALRISQAALLSGSCTDLLVFGLLAAAFVALSKQARQAKPAA
jgi:hypothetical protein